MNIVYPKFVVKMGAGRPSGAADVTDDFPLAYLISWLQAFGKMTEMSVCRRVCIPMTEYDEIAITRLLTYKLDSAV